MLGVWESASRGARPRSWLHHLLLRTSHRLCSGRSRPPSPQELLLPAGDRGGDHAGGDDRPQIPRLMLRRRPWLRAGVKTGARRPITSPRRAPHEARDLFPLARERSMSSTPGPTIEEIRSILADMARCVAADEDPTLDPVIRAGIRRAVDELEQFIPGRDPATDAEGARHMVSAAGNALLAGRARIALARALRGLSYAPHHPELHYLAASACFEMAAPSEAISLLAHTLWIHPGHEKARRELDTLSVFGTGDETGLGELGPNDDDLDRAA